MKNLLLSIIIVVFSLSAFSQTKIHTASKSSSYDIPYEVWTLDNGLTIIVHEDHSDPIVHVEITYHVGQQRTNWHDLCHFFEHMMFQGSENVETTSILKSFLKAVVP